MIKIKQDSLNIKRLIVIFILINLVQVYLTPFVHVSRAASGSATWSSQADWENNQSTTGAETKLYEADTTSVPGDVTIGNVRDYNKRTLETSPRHTVAIKNDGTPISVGNNDNGQRDLTGWDNLNSVAVGWFNTFGLKNNGTVIGAGDNSAGQLGVGGWANIKGIATGSWHVLGLTSAGVVVSAGDNYYGQRDIEGANNIKQVDAKNIESAGLDIYGFAFARGYYFNTLSSFADVKKITISSTVYNGYGIKGDGTVVAEGNNDYGQLAATGWTDIADIACGDAHVIGLKEDGTVVAAGYNEDGRCNTGGWSDIVAVTANSDHSLGLKSDGTVVATGPNDYGELDVTGWTDIKQPTTTDAPLASIRKLKINRDGADMKWSNINWNATTPADTSIKFRTRGADTEADLETQAWSDYYTVSGEAITTGHSEWLEVEAVLEQNNAAEMPALHDLTVTYDYIADVNTSNAHQYDSGTDEIPPGDQIYDNPVTVKISDLQGLPDSTTLIPEVRTNDSENNKQVFSGSAVAPGTEGTVNLTGLDPSIYTYQIRVIDDLGRSSAWSDFNSGDSAFTLSLPGPISTIQSTSDGIIQPLSVISQNEVTVLQTFSAFSDSTLLTPQMELIPYSETYDGSEIVTEDVIAYSGTPVEVSFNFRYLDYNKSYKYRFRYSDDNGRTSDWFYYNSGGIAFSVDVGSPMHRSLSPANNTYIKGRVRISSSISDSFGIHGVYFYDNQISSGSRIGYDLSSPYAVYFNTTSENNGRHTIISKAIDRAGNIGIASHAVIIDNYKPKTYAPFRVLGQSGSIVRIPYKIKDPYSPVFPVIKIKKGTKIYRTIGIGWQNAGISRAVKYKANLPSGYYNYFIYCSDKARNRQYNVAHNTLIVR